MMVKFVRLVGFRLVLALLIGGFATKAAQADTVRLQPSDDAPVYEDDPTKNYSYSSTLYMRTQSGGNNRRSFLKFDLSSIPSGATITEANLHLYCYYVANLDPPNTDVQARKVTDDTWNEDIITWDNQPDPPYGDVIDTQSPVDDTFQVWDVISFVQNQFAGDGTVSFCMRMKVESSDATDRHARYRSKEYSTDSSQKPMLEVTYSEGPETEILRPNAAGDKTDIPVQYPDSGAHWEKVDDVTHDGDSTYIRNNTTAWKGDLYNLPDHTAGGTINSVTLYARCRKVANGVPYVRLYLKPSGATQEYVSSVIALTGSWVNYSNTWTTNPVTDSAWTWGDIDALQAGLKLDNAISGDNADCTQAYVEVNYTPPNPPVVSTADATGVQTDSATLHGNVTDTGGENPTRYFDYDTDSGEPYTYNKDCGTGGTGAYSGEVTDLLPGTFYYFRARAVNSGGTGTGSEKFFVTRAEGSGSSTEDAYIYKVTADSNYGANTTLKTRGYTSDYYRMRTFIKFDISGIPSGSTITSAKLYLYYSRYLEDTTDCTIDVHKVQQSPARDWVELEVTWNSYKTGSAWTSVGGDYSGTVSASKTFPYTPYGWIEWASTAQLVADVQDFLDNPSTNYGWILKDSNEGTGDRLREFKSSNYTIDELLRPKLEITYTPAPTLDVSVLPATWAIGIQPLEYVGESGPYTATNEGNVPEDFAIKGSDGDGGWTIGAVGEDSFEVKADKEDDGSYEITLTKVDQELFSNVAVDGSKTFGLKYSVPDGDTKGGGVAQDFTVTITASEY